MRVNELPVGAEQFVGRARLGVAVLSGDRSGWCRYCHQRTQFIATNCASLPTEAIFKPRLPPLPEHRPERRGCFQPDAHRGDPRPTDAGDRAVKTDSGQLELPAVPPALDDGDELSTRLPAFCSPLGLPPPASPPPLGPHPCQTRVGATRDISHLGSASADDGRAASDSGRPLRVNCRAAGGG